MGIRIFLYSGLALLLISLESCASLSKSHASQYATLAPDYSLNQNWAALPNVIDSADQVPISGWRDEQATSAVDVFFIHPTTFTGKAPKNQWNADLSENKLNLLTDQSTILFQASIFNGAGKIYAPRYRQAHLKCFFALKDKQEAKQALELAYADVKNAFQYYLQHFNQGRPFIIASHSQGSMHAERLISEVIDNTPLQEKMIVAYLPGWPVRSDQFKSVKPCLQPDDMECICSWRTFKKGFVPRALHYPGQSIIVTNPVTWNFDQPSCSKEEQIGSVLRDFHKLLPHLVGAQIHEDLLWVNKPKFPGSFLLTTRNYHIADYNLFYADVRKNAQDRVHAYLSRH